MDGDRNPRHAPLARALRIFTVVDLIVAAFLLFVIVQRWLEDRQPLFELSGPVTGVESAVQRVAGALMPWAMGAVSLSLLALVFFPRRDRRRLAFPAAAVGVTGLIVLACSLSVTWAANEGLTPLFVGSGTIALGAAAHIGLAAWCWRAGREIVPPG